MALCLWKLRTWPKKIHQKRSLRVENLTLRWKFTKTDDIENWLLALLSINWIHKYNKQNNTLWKVRYFLPRLHTVKPNFQIQGHIKHLLIEKLKTLCLFCFAILGFNFFTSSDTHDWQNLHINVLLRWYTYKCVNNCCWKYAVLLNTQRLQSPDVWTDYSLNVHCHTYALDQFGRKTLPNICFIASLSSLILNCLLICWEEEARDIGQWQEVQALLRGSFFVQKIWNMKTLDGLLSLRLLRMLTKRAW